MFINLLFYNISNTINCNFYHLFYIYFQYYYIWKIHEILIVHSFWINIKIDNISLSIIYFVCFVFFLLLCVYINNLKKYQSHTWRIFYLTYIATYRRINKLYVIIAFFISISKRPTITYKKKLFKFLFFTIYLKIIEIKEEIWLLCSYLFWIIFVEKMNKLTNFIFRIIRKKLG